MDDVVRTLKSRDSGEEYTIRYTYDDKFRSCTCPHWQYRLRVSGVQCKHPKQLKEHDELQAILQTKIAAHFEKNWLLDFHSELFEVTKLDEVEDEVSVRDQCDVAAGF